MMMTLYGGFLVPFFLRTQFIQNHGSPKLNVG
uniref:Uncharacterized protein n=1 Tax=Anguilla anguilla TaxID=7936 RepID=A0A0E9QLD2_ANGAN